VLGIVKKELMPTREKTNKGKVLNYVQEQWESAKQMSMFKFLRKEVNIGDNGTQKYMVKQGKNKGKIL
jgi:hypothetical protein|tara:strand:+ start:245 stop:448 length:204 start_codon:yes stop_codon:yes gene_type:complete